MHQELGTRPNIKSVRPSLSALLVLLIGFFIGGISVGSVEWVELTRNPGGDFIARLWSALAGSTTIDASRTTVVDRIRRLQRLETVVYTMDKLVTGARENPILPDFLAGDRLLMLVHGEVVTGIDFSGPR